MSKREFTRREFISAGTGALAAPYIITSTALGNDDTPPASERITVGHIGTGGQGGSLVRGFLYHKDCQSVAVCDPFKYRRDEKAGWIDQHYGDKNGKDNYKACDTYNDFRELLARDDIDAVVIATPDHWHVPIAVAAARAGKAMYVEKPIGVSVGQGQVLRAAVNRYGTVFQLGTQQRSDRNFRLACELVRNGRIGKLHTIDVWCPRGEQGGSTVPIPVPEGFDYDMWLGPAPMAPYTKDRCISGGTARKGSFHIFDYALGFIAGWGIHMLDIAQWGKGSEDTSCPTEYKGTARYPTEGLFDTAFSWDVRCTYADGTKIWFMSDDVARPYIERYHHRVTDHGTTFIGSDGWVSVDRGGIFADPPSLVKQDIGPDEIHLYRSSDHIQNFLDCTRSGAKTVSPVDSAFQSDTICQLGEIAVRTGRTIRWDPAKEEIVDDEAAAGMLTRSMRSPWHI